MLISLNKLFYSETPTSNKSICLTAFCSENKLFRKYTLQRRGGRSCHGNAIIGLFDALKP